MSVLCVEKLLRIRLMIFTIETSWSSNVSRCTEILCLL